MQVWCDIYPDPARPKWYQWRIVIDTIRNMFTVVDDKDRETSYQPTTVARRDNLYLVSDIPTRPGVAGNIQFLVHDRPPSLPPPLIEIVGGGGYYKHVIWADGNKVAEKGFGAVWKHKKAVVLPPNIIMIPKLARYEVMLKTKVYAVEMEEVLEIPVPM